MIPLQRPAAPAYLAANAANETNLLWGAWRAGLALTIKRSVYAHTQVKQALREAQHDKCAYCETKSPRSHDVVEHYRPKQGWRQKPEMTLRRPEYFWLAYDWDNLVFACDMCNDGGHKQNLFPLSNPRSRAKPGNPNTDAEQPLIIDPYREDPNRFIEWNADIPRAKRRSRKGVATMNIFGLDRDQGLIDARRGHFNLVQAALQNAEGLAPTDGRRLETRDILIEYLADSAPYAAMIRTSFRARIEAL